MAVGVGRAGGAAAVKDAEKRAAEELRAMSDEGLSGARGRRVVRHPGIWVASSAAQNGREWVIRRLLAGIRWPTRGVRAGVPASCGISPGRIRARLPPI